MGSFVLIADSLPTTFRGDDANVLMMI